jgi:hypothetical protein
MKSILEGIHTCFDGIVLRMVLLTPSYKIQYVFILSNLNAFRYYLASFMWRNSSNGTPTRINLSSWVMHCGNWKRMNIELQSIGSKEPFLFLVCTRIRKYDSHWSGTLFSWTSLVGHTIRIGQSISNQSIQQCCFRRIGGPSMLFHDLSTHDNFRQFIDISWTVVHRVLLNAAVRHTMARLRMMDSMTRSMVTLTRRSASSALV